MKQGGAVIGGLRFAWLEAGEGPLCLLLHGYPDNAWTWEHQIPVLADAGYRVVAPWLRGYPPSEIPTGGFYDRATLARDVQALIRILAPDGRARLIGQDWGAAIAYGALAAFPGLIERAVVMAIPHPAAMTASLTDPEQIHRAFHWWFFRLAELPERAIRADGFAFIDYLWRDWSPGHTDQAHVDRIKTMLAEPGAVEATLAYYRASFDPILHDPAHADLWPLMERTITVPTLAICGADDIRLGPMASQAARFGGPYRFEVVKGAGHFLHREQPEAVNRLLLEWLAA